MKTTIVIPSSDTVVFGTQGEQLGKWTNLSSGNVRNAG